MKKLLFSLGLAIAATLSFTNCSKELSNDLTDNVIADGQEFSIFALPTKTVNDGLSTKWVAEDQLTVFHAEAGTTSYGSNDKFSIAEEDVATGKFTGTLTEALSSTKSYDWYALYPYTSAMTTPTCSDDKGYITVGNKVYKGTITSQKQTGNNSLAHIAGANYPLYAQAKSVSGDAQPVLSMSQICALVKISVKNTVADPLTVSSIEFTAPEDICGTFFVDIAGDKLSFKGSGEDYVSNNTVLSVTGATALAQNESADFYIGIKPFALAADDEITIKVNSYSKTIKLTKAFEFKSGHIVPVSFNYDYAEPDYSGTYVVLAKSGDNYFAMSGNPGTYSYMPKKDFTYDGTSKSVEVSDAELVWDFAKTANGYTLKNRSNNKYLSYTGSSNAAYVVEAVATGCYMSVSKSEGVFHINESESGRALRYNSGSPRFAFYSTTTGTPDLLLVGAIYSSTPVIQPITNPDKVDAAGATASVNYTVLNPIEGKSVEASSNQTWVNTFDYTTEGKISFKVDANTGEERTATVTVSYPGAANVQFTVTQSAPGAAEDVVFDPSGQKYGYSGYNATWTYGDWSITNGANNNKSWTYIKMGGKSATLSSANPCTISYDKKVTNAIKEIDVNIVSGSFSKTGMSVNSWGVYVYSDSDHKTQVDYVAGGTITSAAGKFTFKPSEGKTWKDCYIVVSWDLANTTTTNGIVCVGGVTISF